MACMFHENTIPIAYPTFINFKIMFTDLLNICSSDTLTNTYNTICAIFTLIPNRLSLDPRKAHAATWNNRIIRG